MALKEGILTASITPGKRLYESTVAKQFDASRTPVREALMRLLEEGLLERQGRAYTVRRMSITEILEVYEARQCLECRAVEKAVEFVTEEDIQALNNQIAAMSTLAASAHKNEFNYADCVFHLSVVRIARHYVYLRLLESIHEKVLLVRNTVSHLMTPLSVANEEHQRIVDALQRRNGAVTVAELNAHIQATIDDLRRVANNAKDR